MARSHEPPVSTAPDLAETKRRLEEQRRRLDRIAERYQQLECALESLESLLLTYSPRGGESRDDAEHGGPRKPR
jgi:hypothetical protein